MTPFDWPTFLDRQGIAYRDHGPNVGKDHIVTHCPFCRDDPSMHMSISLDGNGWRCFRDHSHAGITPTRLIQALTGMPWESAFGLAGKPQQQYVQPSTLHERVKELLQPPPEPVPEPIEWPATSQHFAPGDHASGLPYRLYMRGRGISDLYALAEHDVRYDARDRRWRGRILFGVRHQGQLVAITGRAIGHSEPRYLADGAIDQHLIWADRFPRHASTLVLTEGPFDALKVNLLGNARGIWSTAAMTSSFSPAQRARLYDLLPRFDRTVVLFDRGNEANAHRLANGFGNRIRAVRLPAYADDPAELLDLEWLEAWLQEEDTDA